MASTDIEKADTTPRVSGDSDVTYVANDTCNKKDLIVADVYDAPVDTSSVNEKWLLTKLDIFILPWLSVLYSLGSLDRASLQIAELYGLREGLEITDAQYFIALMIFYFPYAFFQIPSNIILTRIRPSIWLSSLVTLWGLAVTLEGLVQNYSSLLAVRVFIGLLEAGMYPGMTYYLSCWYKRNEYGFRVSHFYASATIGVSFGAVLAVALVKMDGSAGRPGWAWIFIVQGLVTIFAGVISFFVIPDSPQDATFLTPTERTFVVKRLEEDNRLVTVKENFGFSKVWECFKDRKNWLAMGVYMGNQGPVYALFSLLPTIVGELGFATTSINLLVSAPAVVVGCLCSCIVGFVADRRGGRGFFNIGCLLVAGTGVFILIFSKNAILSYVAMYIAMIGIYSAAPNVVAWVSGNLEGSFKRSISMAMVLGWGDLQGAVASNLYRPQLGPWFPIGNAIVLIYIAIGLICSVALIFLLRKENRGRDLGQRDEVVVGINDDRTDLVRNGIFDTVDEARLAKGDEWSGFRYMY